MKEKKEINEDQVDHVKIPDRTVTFQLSIEHEYVEVMIGRMLFMKINSKDVARVRELFIELKSKNV